MKSSLSFLVFCCLFFSGSAQDIEMVNGSQATTKQRFFDNLELRYYTGRIRPHHEEMEPWKEYSTHGVELRLGRQGRGEKYWEYAYKYPNYGLTLYWMTMGSDTLGQAGAIAGFTTFPMVRQRNFVAGLELTAGVAAGFNPNDPETNPGNYAIGSFLNVYFNFGGYMKYRVGKKFSLSGGAHLVHFSNASARAPNLGINLLHYHLGLLYHFKQQSRNSSTFKPAGYLPVTNDDGFIVQEKQPITKRWGAHASIAAGFRQTLHTGNANYGIFNFSTDLTYQLIYISKLAFGLDFMYDAANVQFYRDEKAQGIPHNNANNFFIGFRGGHELHIERFSIILHAGYYLRKPEKVDNIYGRMGLRCRFGKKWWGNVSFKVHNYTTAQYIEWGVGRDLF